MAAAPPHPDAPAPLDRFVSFLARTEAPGEWVPWLTGLLGSLAALVGADAAMALFGGAAGALRLEGRWSVEGASPLEAWPGSAPAFVAQALEGGGVTLADAPESAAPGGYDLVACVPLLVEGERVGVLVLAWREGANEGLGGDERMLLQFVGRYLGGARRRLELARAGQAAAQEAQRLGRMYAALSQSSQAIVRAQTRQELLERVCGAVCRYLDPGGRSLAAIGFLDEAHGRFEVRHSAGGPKWLLGPLRAALAGAVARGEGPVGLAMRSGAVQVARDLKLEAEDAPVRGLALKAGYRSLAAAPMGDGERQGALVLFAAEPGFFTQRDRELVAELAADVTYGLGVLSATERLREREATLKAILDQAAEGIVVTDGGGRIEQVNRTVAELVGRTVPELLGQNLRALVTDAGRGRRAGRRRRSQESSRQAGFVGEAMARHADGSAVPVALRVGAVDTVAGSRVLASLLDLRESKALAARLEHLALHDPVTGLWNRQGFSQRFRKLAAAARSTRQRLGVALVDLDDFRSLNDVFGHSAGDQVLRALSRRLERQVGEQGVVARVGGDEFALLELLDDDLPPERWLLRILDATERDVRFGPRRGHVGISVGVAILPDDGQDLDVLFARADFALYSVKSRGGHGGRLFHPGIERQQDEVRQVRDGMSEALRSGDLVLHYQPQVDMLSRRVVGLEALMRWRGRDGSLRLPGQFLPLLRDETLICRVGAWVLGEALGAWRAWRAQCQDLRLAVNVAPPWFLSGAFLADVRTALARAGIDEARGLELEITESTALQDLERARERIAALHAMGISVALDDFGTGYASLGYLQELAVDSIKIDTSFTRRLLNSTDSWSIMQAILLMAAGSDRSIVAEGVESTAIEEAVLRLGVRVGQGFAFAEPLPAEAVLDWVGAFPTRDGAAGRYADGDVLAGSNFLSAVYLHLRWMQRVVVATRHPDALEAEVSLADDSQCPLLRWAAERGDAVAAELAARHQSQHRLAARLLERRPADPAERAARIAAFVDAQVAFFSHASAVFFAAEGVRRRGPAATAEAVGTSGE